MICVLAGRPFNDEGWDEDMRTVHEEITRMNNELRYGGCSVLPTHNHGRTNNRRGDYLTFNYGISYGGGQKVRFLTRTFLQFGLTHHMVRFQGT